MTPLCLGVLVSGRGSNLQAILDAITTGRLDARVAVVVSDKSNAPALRRAKENGIPAFVVERNSFTDTRTFELTIVESLKEHDVKLVILAGFMRVLGSTFIRHYSDRIVNIHPSLLPSFPGLHAQRQALEHGVKISGCTVHYVDETLDGGPIIAQAAVPVLPGDTEESLSERILKEEHRLLPETIQSIRETLP